ncbi:MAG TPA: ATP-binding protein [Vicinamibacterales bacterium]|nr:ATP-binding protein [Vicinamibacterales bacterium]
MKQSLRIRLPIAMAVFIAVVLTAFLGTAYRQMESTLLESGQARAQAASDQLAGLLALQLRQRVADVDRAARSEAVRSFLLEPSEQHEAPARAALAALGTVGQPDVELWNEKGDRVLTVAPPPRTGPAPANAPRPLAIVLRPTGAGVMPLRVANDVVFWDVIGRVTTAASGTTDKGTPLGYIVGRRVMSASGAASDQLSRLVGRGAAIRIGNRSGDVWTDLSKAIPSLPIDATRTGAAEYRDSEGTRRIGANAVIGDSPWAAWVEFPRDLVMEPAAVFLRLMSVIGIAFLLIVTFLSHVLTARLASTTEQLDQFFGLSLDMLCIAGTDGRFKRLNPAWTTTLGWTDEELRTRPYIEFVHPDDRPATIERSGELARGAAVIAFENRYQARDGSYRWLQWKAVPAGDGKAVYASTRDVSEQRATSARIETLNGQLQQRVGELDALSKELEAFSYSVSHDLRAPLRHVTGFASLLQKSLGDRMNETESRYVHTIVDAAARMGRLIDDLLAFSRMGRAPLTLQRVRLARLVDDAKAELSQATDGKSVEWVVHPLPDVDADWALLRLAMVNLLSNAVKYSGHRDRAVVEIGEDGSTPQETVVYVRDNGVGFDMQYAHKLFGVFQRLHSSDEFEGTGIGLANVRRIVQRHGGRVWAEGAVDKGATFFIALPNQGDVRR